MFIVDGLNVYFTTRSSILIPCKEHMKSQHGRRRKERHMGKYPCICVTLRACSPVLRFSRYVDICPVDIDRKLTSWTTYYIIDDPHVVIYFWSLTFPTKWSEILFVSVVFLIKWYHLLTSFTSFWMFILARHLESISYAVTVKNCPAVNLRCWLDAWGW